MNVTPEFILDGCIRALQSAHSTLGDAIFLCVNGRAASAYIVGTVAQEHLGRANWMAGQWQQLRTGSLALECTSFSKALQRDHQSTLSDGIVSLGYMPDPSERAMSERLYALKPDDPDYANVSRQFVKFTRTRIRRAPKEYFDMRVRAQYVNPSAGCQSWHFPAQVSLSQTSSFLKNVGGNYRVLFFNLQEQPEIAQRTAELALRAELSDMKQTWMPDEWSALIAREERIRRNKQPRTEDSHA